MSTATLTLLAVQGSSDVTVPNVGPDVQLSGNLDKGQFKSEQGQDASADSEPKLN